jgi:phage terminase large subunit-like protein
MLFRSFAIFLARTQGLRNRMLSALADAISLFSVTSLRNTTIKILTVSRENHKIHRFFILAISFFFALCDT